MSLRPAYNCIHSTGSKLGLVRRPHRKRPKARITLDHAQKLQAVLLRDRTQKEGTTKSNKATYEAYNRHSEESKRSGGGWRNAVKDLDAGRTRYARRSHIPTRHLGLAPAARTGNSEHVPISFKPSGFAPPSVTTHGTIAPTEIVQEPKGFHHTETLSYHWHTPAPKPDQLNYAGQFFLSKPCELLYTVSKLHEMKVGSTPEVAFLGRSNIGKSSLLNALMGQELCFQSKKPGLTKTMNAFAVGGPGLNGAQGKIAILDMPGYGFGSRDAWGQEILKYLVGRDQLKRAFLLVDALHGLKPSDIKILEFLRQNQVSHQVILSKVDRILVPGAPSSAIKLDNYYATLRKIMENMRKFIHPGKADGPEALGEILACSSKGVLTYQQTRDSELKSRREEFIGVAGVRWAILVATGFERQSKMDIIAADNKRGEESKVLNARRDEKYKLHPRWNPESTKNIKADIRTQLKRALKLPKRHSPLTEIRSNEPPAPAKMKTLDLYNRSKL